MLETNQSSSSSQQEQKNTQTSSAQSILASFVCGCLGGIGNILSSHPLDTIKVRMQILDMKLISCFKYITASEGVWALYKGITSPLFNVPLLYAMYFGTYEFGKWAQGFHPNQDISTSGAVIAGAGAGLAVCCVMTPVELIKCRLQMQGTGRKVHTTTAYQLARDVVSSSGFRELYKGNLITILREIPAGAVYFGSYEYCKRKLEQNYGNKYFVPLLAGGTAGLLSWIVSYPQDVIKTKLQCDSGLVRKYPQNKLIRDGGIISCAKDIWKHGGLTGFTKGFSACGLKAIIAEATTFFIYENTKKLAPY